MKTLARLCEEIGFEAPRTHLRSGNVVFRTRRTRAGAGKALEAALLDACGFEVECMVRSTGDMDRIIEENPYPEAALDRPSHLTVVFLQRAPSAAAADALGDRVPGPEPVALIGEELYVDYVNGIGRSKLTAAAIEKALGANGPRGTARNWNTVLKVAQLARDL